jgi:hypothetical protein
VADNEKEEKSNKFELMAGLTIAIFAAVLAVNDLGAGKYGDDESHMLTEKGGDYAWYQAKSIKASLLKGQSDLVKELVASGVIPREKAAPVEESLKKQKDTLTRYSVEMEAILNGYAAGTNHLSYAKLSDKQKEEFVQEFGQVVGAKKRERSLEYLGNAGDRYDLGTLFLQMALVLGAIGLVIQKPAFKWGFFMSMIAMGGVGVVYTVLGYVSALAA